MDHSNLNAFFVNCGHYFTCFFRKLRSIVLLIFPTSPTEFLFYSALNPSTPFTSPLLGLWDGKWIERFMTCPGTSSGRWPMFASGPPWQRLGHGPLQGGKEKKYDTKTWTWRARATHCFWYFLPSFRLVHARKIKIFTDHDWTFIVSCYWR